MSKFLFAYRAPKNYSPGSDDVMAAWNAWLEGLGPNLVDAGNPVFERSTLGNCVTDTVLGGYSLITADDLDAAVALAQGCPALRNGGAVEVGELTLANPDSVASTVADHARATQLAN
jgi:YCII-related domain